MAAGTWLLGAADDGSPVYHQNRPPGPTPDRAVHIAASLAEGICPDHLTPFAGYAQMFDWRPHRFRCALCGPDVIWLQRGERVESSTARRLPWKPA